MKIQNFRPKNQTQGTKLSGKNTQHVAICQKQQFPEDFQIFWNLESGNLEILKVPKNAKKYSKIDLRIRFFSNMSKKNWLWNIFYFLA